MPFAAHEIENKRFVVALRGYQTDEVDAFLRAVAADYRAALEAASGESPIVEKVERAMSSALEQARQHDGRQEWLGELQRVMEELRAAARADATEIREAAQADARQIRATAHAQANVAELRLEAQSQARELRAAAEAEAEEIRTRAEREAAEIRDAAIRESEAAYAEITRQADELRRLESALWSRMHALEHTVVECRQALTHVSGLQPMQPASVSPLATPTLPSVDELLYRVEASLATETNVEVATADL
jgi:DivIVA domain-containing protein